MNTIAAAKIFYVIVPNTNSAPIRYVSDNFDLEQLGVTVAEAQQEENHQVHAAAADHVYHGQPHASPNQAGPARAAVPQGPSNQDACKICNATYGSKGDIDSLCMRCQEAVVKIHSVICTNTQSEPIQYGYPNYDLDQ